MSTVLTCFIAVLTFRYVALTGTLAEAAKKQVEIAQLQANTAKDLKAATLQQQQLEQQRSADARARDQSTAEVARRQLSGLAARYRSVCWLLVDHSI